MTLVGCEVNTNKNLLKRVAYAISDAAMATKTTDFDKDLALH